MGFTGVGANGEVYTTLAGEPKWSNVAIRVNESVVYEDMTVKSSQHWTVYDVQTVDPGFVLDIEAGGLVVIV